MSVPNPKDEAARAKLAMSLVPGTMIAYLALSLTEGEKYRAYNWRVAGVKVSVYMDALERHKEKFMNGEWADKETLVPHLASMLGCVGIVVDAYCCGTLIDDRPPKCDMTAVLEYLTEVARHLKTIHPNTPERFTELWMQQQNNLSRTELEDQLLSWSKKTLNDVQKSESESTASGSKPSTGGTRCWTRIKRFWIWLVTFGRK